MKILNREYFWLILISFLILPFFVLSFFIFPSADDYSVNYLLSQYNFWEYQKYMYLNWSGRYIANLTDTLNPMQNLFFYRIIPVILLILLYIALFFFFKSFLKTYLKKIQLHLFSLIFMALYLNIFPSPAEGIYWFPAAKNYLLANILTFFLIAFIYQSIRSNNKNEKRLLRILNILLAFIIIGLNIISVLVVLWIIVIAIALTHFVLKKKQTTLLLLLFNAIIFSVLVFIAPGNFVHMSQFSDTMNLTKSLLHSAVSSLKIFGIHIQNPAFMLLSFYFVVYFTEKIKNQNPPKIFMMNPIIFLLISFLVLCSMFFVAYMIMGINPPMRINALASLIFMVLWFFLLLNICVHLSKHNYFFSIPDPFVYVFLGIVIILTLLDFYREPAKQFHFRSNITAAYYDLFFVARNYKNEMKDRFQFIEKSKISGIEHLKVKPIHAIPKSIYFVDITGDSTHWINTYYAQYYGLKSISTTPQHP